MLGLKPPAARPGQVSVSTETSGANQGHDSNTRRIEEKELCASSSQSQSGHGSLDRGTAHRQFSFVFCLFRFVWLFRSITALVFDHGRVDSWGVSTLSIRLTSFRFSSGDLFRASRAADFRFLDSERESEAAFKRCKCKQSKGE